MLDDPSEALNELTDKLRDSIKIAVNMKTI